MAPLALEADGIGTFPPRGTPRVVWVGLSGDRASLMTLHAALSTALKKREFKLDEKAYAPHITLGRLGQRVVPGARDRASRVGAYCTSHKALGRWTAHEVHLIQSELRSDGPRYTTLYTSALRGRH